MATVLINSQPYTTYADIEDADLYLAGSSNATAWRALSDDDIKARALITSTRILDRQTWIAAYETFAARLAVEKIVNASIELANYIVNGIDVLDQQNQSQKIQRLKAGSVEIEYFRGAEGFELRFPVIIEELIGDCLAGRGGSLLNKVSGTDGVSITGDDYGYNRGL